ncbi:hypothetical protein I4U23_026129 [Adineta vaga]|nr:hypothetical protein I4U23_026129 [Adineta vaga]
MGTSLFEFINHRYLLGISDEPKQMLQPIAGYVHEPLLPLEKACEPLLDLVDRLEAHIWIAKENTKNPTGGLTPDESAAIHLYTMEWDGAATQPHVSLYAQLNRTLKQVDRTKLRPWFRYLKLFLTALAKLPCEPHQTVWRGVRKDHSVDYPPGAQVTWWAFSSCTTSLSVLESDLYLGNVGTRTLFSIETINGRTIRAHSHFTTEDEILLLPGTYLEVKSRLNPATDLYIVHLQQKVPPHVLLEPPFPGAQLLPGPENDRDPRKTSVLSDKFYDDSTPWYKKKKILFCIIAVLALIILAIVLGAVLGTRNKNKNQTQTSTVSTPNKITTLAPIYPNGSIPNPVSIADAFYAFDGDINDLYSRRNGEVIGGSVSYITGYVPYGKAVVLTQFNATRIDIEPTFDLETSSSFTIEGFFMLQQTQMNATLVQLTPNIKLNLVNGFLIASIGSDISLVNNIAISPDQWHHFGFVYNTSNQMATTFIDGTIITSLSSVVLDISGNNTNSSIIIGADLQGCIDQLSILIKAKSPSEVLWDATTAGYYPMDEQWLLDKGPNGLNASAASVITIFGWHFNALNFNHSDAYYQANGFTVLGTPQQSFSITLWIRAETQAGAFLTIANAYTCLLVLGLQTDRNRLVAYLPNATATGEGVNIIGPEMPLNAWTHVAFTWSAKNLAKLYTSTYLQSVSASANTLNNVRGGNNSLPMTVTLGKYSGPANCAGIQGVNTSQPFMGSLDELFVFSRELQSDDMQVLVQT